VSQIRLARIAAWCVVVSSLVAPHRLAAQARASSRTAPFTVVETSIADLRRALEQKRTTSHEVVQQYLLRIATYEDRLNAIITVNPRALAIADSLDRERARERIRGPLHGIPIALKDNVNTTAMRTTGGALAFRDLVPPYDATLAKNLEDAGAIIIAKTQLTELANWVAVGMPANYNGLNGYGMNPWDPRRDPRESTFDGRPVLSTGGSSSGVGTNVSFWAANVGTETSGSILSPSNQNMLVGIKPTVGRISRYGVIPITADQDTPGPMAKYVMDVAIMFGALESASPDPNDPATRQCTPPPGRDYTKGLRTDGLKGARIGIPRANYYDPITLAGSERPRGGLNEAQRKVMDDAIAVLKAQGAIVVDVDIPSIVAKDAKDNLLLSGQSSVLNYGMKRDFNKWLQSLGEAAPVKSLTELREWNTAHEKMGAIKYGQSQLDNSDTIDLEKDKAKYEEDRARDIRLAGMTGIDAAIKANNLDALLFPGSSSAGIASKPGYPTVLVPFAMIPNTPGPLGFGGGGRGGGRGDAAGGRGGEATPPTTTPAGTTTPGVTPTPPATAPSTPPAPFPPGFDPKPQPYGVGFTGSACSEPTLLRLAYAFEQATKKRTPPAGLR
jgi:amidase